LIEALPVTPASLAVAAVAVACGYFVFGMSGFGAALVTVPVISHLWPVQFVLPVLAVLDFIGGMFLGVRHNKQTERSELTRMIPLALLGAVLGVTLLVNLPRNAALAGVGTFAVMYGVATGPMRRGSPAVRPERSSGSEARPTPSTFRGASWTRAYYVPRSPPW
jgi:uncharacterized membrane protein YfcA